MKQSLFITFEGLDGSGKTFQSKLLADFLREKLSADKIVLTQAPSGTPFGKELKKILLDSPKGSVDSLTETLLFAAAHKRLVEEVIKPALSSGKIVICDRFLHSFISYQGYARGLFNESIFLSDLISEGGKIFPDVTFFLKVPPSEIMRRKPKSLSGCLGEDRIESEPIEFHRKVWEGYCTLNKKQEGFYDIGGHVCGAGVWAVKEIAQEIQNVTINEMKERGIISYVC